MVDQNIHTCQFCGKGFQLKTSLNKHNRNYTAHKPNEAGIRSTQDEISELLAVDTYHRHARIHELLRQLSQDKSYPEFADTSPAAYERFPVLKDPTLVREAQLSHLELHRSSEDSK